jgi:hypothetical protein
LDGRKIRKSVNSVSDLFQFKHLEIHSEPINSSASLTLKILQSGALKTGDKLSFDSLTGLSSNQAIAGQTASTIAGSAYSPAYGYGLVNAAKAVAWAAGYYPYSFTDNTLDRIREL